MKKQMRKRPRNAKGRFTYICSDPVTDGQWKILSPRALTKFEIDRQLRFVAAFGHERPERGRFTTFKWPARINLKGD
jgi:hypothetical protein